MELLILVVLIVLNGVFTMSEIALVSARKARLETMAEKGDKKAASALDLSNSPELFLSAAQIGITLIAILTGVYSGERFGAVLQPHIEKIAALEPYAKTISTTLVVIITFSSSSTEPLSSALSAAGTARPTSVPAGLSPV